MKLLIAVPTMYDVQIEFVKSLMALTRRLDREGVDFDVKFRVGTLVYMARDNFVLDALNGKYTHVLWLDSDMVFDDDIVEKLTEPKRPFVTGLAHTRRYPYESCIFTSLDPDVRPDDIPDEPFEVEACGFACVFIDTRIMTHVMFKHFCCFSPNGSEGEDIAFCKRAKALGYHIWCQPSVKLGHVGQMTVWPDNAAKLREVLID